MYDKGRTHARQQFPSNIFSKEMVQMPVDSSSSCSEYPRVVPTDCENNP